MNLKLKNKSFYFYIFFLVLFIHFQMGWWLYYFFNQQEKYYNLLQNYDFLILKILNNEDVKNLKEISYIYFDPKENKYKIDLKIYEKREREKKRNRVMLISEIVFSLLLFLIISLMILKFYHKKNQLLMDKILFLNSFTHELKTPLTTVKLNLQTLQKKIQKQYLCLIETSISELNLLNEKINQILFDKDITIPSFKEFNLIDLEELLSTILSELEYKIAKSKSKVFIEKELIENPIKLMIPYRWLFIVLKELITNAIKYSDKEVKIKISKKNSRFKKYLQISIINPRKSSLFEHLETSGTGLGLHYVKELLKKCSGKIILENHEASLEVIVLIHYI